jgi:hypothetical protein
VDVALAVSDLAVARALQCLPRAVVELHAVLHVERQRRFVAVDDVLRAAAHTAGRLTGEHDDDRSLHRRVRGVAVVVLAEVAKRHPELLAGRQRAQGVDVADEPVAPGVHVRPLDLAAQGD